MNGRVYDPLLGRFLSADLLVQRPGDLQSFNRYSYVRNNPLTLTDPSGWADDDNRNGGSGLWDNLKDLIAVYIPSQAALPGRIDTASAPSRDGDEIAARDTVQGAVQEAHDRVEGQLKVYAKADEFITGGVFTEAAQAGLGKDIKGQDMSPADRAAAAGRAAINLGLMAIPAGRDAKQATNIARLESGSVKTGLVSKVTDFVKSAVHHIATDKNSVSTATGGPWTPRFKAIFDKAGMTLGDSLNKLRVAGHEGPHSQAYHTAVFDRLTQAIKGLKGEEYKTALQNELKAMAKELKDEKSEIYKLLMKK